MLSFEEARSALLDRARVVGAERVPLDLADGRVLREDVIASRPSPAFDYSSMDGYAVRLADLSGEPPFDLEVRGESSAGGPLATFTPGTALRIFTGAPLPAPADAVVMQENVERNGDRARITQMPRLFEYVRRKGEDLGEGTVALATGTRLGPGGVALAASLDRPTLAVSQRPRVVIVATGDELRTPGEPGLPGTIAESNAYFVSAAARRAGAIATVAPFVRDDRERAEQAFAEALAGADLVITIGGVSVGDHDVVRPALESAGVTIDFYRVAIKPGKPLTVGSRGSTLVLGLPGNPASASLTFLLFGVPLLRAMQGDRSALPLPDALPVHGRLSRVAGRKEFARATLTSEGGKRFAVLAPNQASGAVTSFASADALVILPEAVTQVNDGDVFDVLRIADLF